MATSVQPRASQRNSSRGPAPAPGDPAPDSTLTDTEGRTVRLSEVWRDKPLVLVFLRHLGCIFCREQLALLKTGYPDLSAAGAQVVCVSQGPHTVAKALKILMDLPFPLLTCGDDLAVFRAYGLGRVSWGRLFSPATFAGVLRAMLRGHRQTGVIGDGRQMAGGFVIDRQGLVRYAYRNKGLADHVANGDLLTALMQIKKERSK